MAMPTYVLILERMVTVVLIVYTLQKDVFEKLQSEFAARKCLHPPLTLKTRLPLLVGPIGTWGALSFVLWGFIKITQRASDTPLLDYQALWLLLCAHGLGLLLLIPRFLAFYPLLRYFQHPHPFRHAYQLSQTWRFYLLLAILSPLLTGNFFLITKFPNPSSWLQTAPLFVPCTTFVFVINMTCMILLCLSLVRKELTLKEQEARNNSFISGRPTAANDIRPSVKSP